MGGIEGAGMEALLAPGMNPGDEVPGELLGAHPHAGGNVRVLGCIFGLESRFSYRHSSTTLLKSIDIACRCCGKFRPVLSELERNPEADAATRVREASWMVEQRQLNTTEARKTRNYRGEIQSSILLMPWGRR
jgi:hypothetical protein